MNKRRFIYISFCIVLVLFLLFLNRNSIVKWIMFSNLRVHYSSFITSSNINKGLIPLDSVSICSFELSHDLDRGGVWSDDQDVTHPSAIKVGNTTWIALTPYPQALDLKGEPYENACIFYSDNGSAQPNVFKSIKRNPVIYKGDAKYNSDCDLYYDDSDSLFYLINRKRHLPHTRTQIVMQNSKDGQEWTSPIVLFETERETLCPCLVKVDSVYKIFAFNSKDQATMCDNTEVWVSSSLSNPHFSLEGMYPWTNNHISIWHGDIVYEDGIYYMTSCGINNSYKTRFGSNDHYKYLWFGTSSDGVNWDFNSNPIIKANGVYRSTMYFDGDSIVFYFSFHQRYYDDIHHAGNVVCSIKTPKKRLLK